MYGADQFAQVKLEPVPAPHKNILMAVVDR